VLCEKLVLLFLIKQLRVFTPTKLKDELNAKTTVFDAK